MNLSRQYSFWGSLSHLGGLAGAGLLVMASGRLSWAVTITGSLLWVYGLTAFTYTFLITSLGHRFFPVQGKIPVFTCIASFFASIYIFLFWLLCPFAALEVFIQLLLVPLFCAASGIVQNIPAPELQIADDSKKQGSSQPPKIVFNPSVDVFEQISNAVSQAVSLSILIIAFSIVREPLSYSSLSFPGTYHGMMIIMYFRDNFFFPIGIFSQSAGALIILGYVTCLYQYGRSKLFPGENK